MDPAPWVSAGSHHGERSSGTRATAAAGGPQVDRSPITLGSEPEGRRDDEDAEHEREQPGDGREGGDHGQQQPAAPGRPPPSLRRRVGEPERGVRQPGQEQRRDDRAEPTVAPGAGDDGDQARTSWRPTGSPSAAHRRSAPAGRSPAGSARRPTSRPGRRAGAGARRRRPGFRRGRSRAARAAGRTPGPARRCPGRARATTTGAGATRRRPRRGRARDRRRRRRRARPARRSSAATTKAAVRTATGLVKNRATRPVSSTISSSSRRSSCSTRRAANDAGSSSALAARRRSATSAACWPSALPRSRRKSMPCRYGSHHGGSRRRTSSGSAVRAAARARRAAVRWPGCRATETSAARSSSASPGERTSRKPTIRTNVPSVEPDQLERRAGPGRWRAA